LAIVAKRISDDPVVLFEGPRSVGKSTLLKEVTEESGGRILSSHQFVDTRRTDPDRPN
jgi:predicted AAA+ superfamily ATPase